MAKILTREDSLKKSFKKLEDINQRLKNISSCYYVHFDGVIYMKSLLKITETVVHLRYPETIEPYLGAMILPNRFFDFYKNAKKTKMTIDEGDYPEEGGYKFHFGQTNDRDLKFTMDIVNNPSHPKGSFIESMILPQMYKRFFGLNEDNYTIYSDKDEFVPLLKEDVENLCNAKALFLNYKGMELTFTKNLFLDLKKDDSIAVSRCGYQPIEDDPNCLFIYMIKHDTELYTSYTIFGEIGKSPK